MNNAAHLVICILAALLAALVIARVVLTCRAAGGAKDSGVDTGAARTCGSRDVQEDCHAVLTTNAGTVAALADGRGKNQGGSVSSSLAVETVLDLFESGSPFQNPNYFFQNAFKQANRRILDQLDDGYGGASVAVILFDGRELNYAVVGNVHVAVFRDGNLIQVTEGHTVNVLAEKKYLEGSLTRQDTIALLRESRLYNYVGRDEFQNVEVFDKPITLRRRDIIVLMSEGVYEVVPHAALEETLAGGGDCQRMADAVIAAVDRAKGAKENASIILIAV